MTRRRGAWLDVVVVLVLMATVLSIFDDTFADRDYLVSGMVPVVLLLTMALLASRLRDGGWWYTLAGVAVFSPMAAIAALREPGPFLLPTLETVGRVLAESVDAPVTLVSTVPPVDSSGTVMLVPFLIGFLATLPSAWLALGTTRPLAPVVPIGLALAATIPLGVLVPTLLVPRGIFVAIVLMAWAAVRARRREVLAGAPRGSTAAATIAVVTVALVALPLSLLVPDEDKSDRVLLRGEANTPLVAEAATTVVPPEPEGSDVLFKATGVPDGHRLRFAVLDLYDGESWVPAEESPGSEGYGTFKRIGPEVAALHPGRTEVVRIQMRSGYASDWLPILGELTTIDFEWNPGRTKVSDVRYNQATASAFVLGGVDVRDAYSFEAVVADDGFTRRDATQDPTDEQRQPEGAFLDERLRPFDRDELLPLERVLLLARYLRQNGTVRYGVAVDQSPEQLAGRMLGSRRIIGTPLQYSALLALGASRLGVPARVVTGADVGRRGLVDHGDVVSWVELQFADGTWRTLDPERYVGTRLDDATTQPPAPPDADQFVRDQVREATGGGDNEIRPAEGAVDPDGTAADQPPAPWVSALGAFGSIAALALLVLALVPVVKVLRRRRRGRRTTSSWSAAYVAGWQEVLDVARDRGTPVPEGRSRLAQARELGVDPELARAADAAVFAPVPAPEVDRAEFWRACQAARVDLLRGVDRRRRLWAAFNPASLLAGWRRRRSDREGSRPVRDEDRGPRRQHAARS